MASCIDAPNITDVLPTEDKNWAAMQLVLEETVPPEPVEPPRATLDPPSKVPEPPRPPPMVPPEPGAAVAPPLALERLIFDPVAPPLPSLVPPVPPLIEPLLVQPKAMTIAPNVTADSATPGDQIIVQRN